MKKILNNLEEIIAGIFICITVFSVIINVMLRTFGGSPISSAEEIATTSFIWSIYIGGAACFKKKMHIGVDMLVQLFPKKLQKIFMILVNIFITILTGVLFYLSIIFTKYSISKPTSVLGISSAYVNSALIVGFGLILIHSVGFTLNAVKNINKEEDK